MSKVIMTVDDSVSVRQMVGFTLKREGFEVVEAVDGVDALKRLEGEHAVHMMITDLNMPSSLSDYLNRRTIKEAPMLMKNNL